MKRYGEIYIITNRANGKRYIGQTIKSSYDRWKQHVGESKYKKNGYAITRAISKYGENNFEVFVFCSCSNREQLDFIENFLISELDSLVPNGYNLREGGRGHSFCKETRYKMRIAKLGRHQTPEAIENHAKTLRGKKKPEGLIAALIATIVIQVIDHNGKIYPSISAASRETGCSASCITRVVQGKLPQIKGFSFARVSENRIPTYDPDRPRGQNRSEGSRKKMAETKQCPIEDQHGKRYASTKEAAAELGCSISAISKVLCGHNKTCKGLSFKFVDKAQECKNLTI
jgi:hypothetical protein